MSRKIVINIIGTLGDLHPMIALAGALKNAGLEPVFAASHDYLPKIRKAGFKAHGVSPGLLDRAATLGFSEEEFMDKVITSQREMMTKFILGPLSETARELEKVMEGAIAVIGGPFSYAGHIMADKYKVKFIMAVLQPGLMATCYNPMVTPEIPIFIAPAKNPLSRMWNRGWISFAKFAGRRLFSKSINSVRDEHGLARKPNMPIYDSEDTPLILGLYSDVLGALEPDMYPQTHITGFPVFDSQSGTPEKLDPALVDFIDAAPPPLVFSLGSLAFHVGRDFYLDSIKVTKQLGKRAVLLTGKGMDLPSDENIFVADYAPHSELFPRVDAIIHHGGIGSTGRALMAGKPQLIVPFNGDQFDNARRVKQLGIGKTLPFKKYTAARAEKSLGELLDKTDIRQSALTISEKVSCEKGAEKASALILECLEDSL